MTLNQLRYLIAIADAKLNISFAATQVNATQPALSRQLKLIEEELGFEVFTRRGKSLGELTRSGSDLIARARAILGEVRNIEAIAANHRQETRGRLRVATTQAIGRFVLPRALARLRERFGSVQVQLRPGDASESALLLDRDEIDLAFVNTEGERPTGGVVIPLFTWQRALIAKAGHPLAALRVETLADLAEVPLIAAENVTRAETKLGLAFHRQGIQPNIACTARDADTIKTFVSLGLGVGLIAEMALSVDDDELVDLGGNHLFPTCTTWAILRDDRIQRDYVLELLHELSPALNRSDIISMLHGSRPEEFHQKIKSWRSMRNLARAPSDRQRVR